MNSGGHYSYVTGSSCRVAYRVGCWRRGLLPSDDGFGVFTLSAPTAFSIVTLSTKTHCVQRNDAPERSSHHHLRGPFDAGGQYSSLVPRRLERRKTGTNRFCSSVRASDVQGFGTHQNGGARQDHHEC